jgi:O-antigen chain-terminating methyltransferase
VADQTRRDELDEIRRRLEDEEAAYAAALAALDEVAAYPLPEETGPEVQELLGELNALAVSPPHAPARGGIAGILDRGRQEALAPLLERHSRFHEVLVRMLNARRDHHARHHARLRSLAEALVRFAQRVEPLIDARDAMRVARIPTRAEQVLEIFGRRLEAMQQRLEGLLALRDRVETLTEELAALRRGLQGGSPPPEVARSALEAATDSAYTAFENRFRGPREGVRTRQEGYVELFREQAPVVDLGCGRGEFLELLRAAGIAASGVEGNAHVVRECREKGLEVALGDLVESLQARDDGSVGGLFAAQVAEHLPPPVLAAFLGEAHRTLRKGGVLVLETPNPASALAFHDVFIRDLTHERPLHPETLRFMAAAAGFSDVRVQMQNPVPEDVRLRLVPGGGLPPPVVQALNENVERLNALLFAPLDYALIARR